jgi:cytochrome c nitrite reductase small subunit
VIFILEKGKEVVEGNCKRCHERALTLIGDESCKGEEEDREGRKCWECHSEVPHGSVNSLSSVPYARVPLPSSPVPDWLDQLLLKESE